MIHRSESIVNLAAALTVAQGEFGPVAKNAENPHFRSKFADFQAILSAVVPILTKNNLAVSQHPCVHEGVDALETMLLHSSGEYLTSTMLLHLDKPGMQALGSAITYSKRYALLAILGIGTFDEDDDGNAAQAHAERTTNQKSGISEAQMKLINSLTTERKFPVDVKDYVSEIVGREVASPKSLTSLEARKVIEAMMTLPTSVNDPNKS
jgi:hypothetical protein